MKITANDAKLKLYRKSGISSLRTNERTVELPLRFTFIDLFARTAIVELVRRAEPMLCRRVPIMMNLCATDLA